MAAYFQFQRVRIVRASLERLNGMECTLMEAGDVEDGESFGKGWRTDIPHPFFPGGWVGVFESQIEPLKFDPMAEDFDQAKGEDFELLAPVPVIVTHGDGA